MSRASTPTLLSLDRWAKILTINPVHFSGGVGSLIWPLNGACQEPWPQYSWQTNHELVGRDEVAMTVATTEDDIKRAIGYSPRVTWEVDEFHTWPSAHNHYIHNHAPVVQTEFGYVIAGGRRAVELIDADAAVVRTDPDGDGWAELATITVATTATDRREIKLYFAGEDGDVEFEIRPLRNVVLSGGNAIITVDAWMLIDPDIWEEYPNTSTPFEGIDVTVGGNFVSVVDVYREYNDNTVASSTFHTISNGYGCCGGVGCDVCAGTTYGGCLSLRDARLGIISPEQKAGMQLP